MVGWHHTHAGESEGEGRTRDCVWLTDASECTMRECRLEYAFMLGVVCWDAVICTLKRCIARTLVVRTQT
jgi:hypothetical protein